MTIQELKNNRNEIIDFINSRNYNLKFAMEIAVEICENVESIDELMIELECHCRPVKCTKNAAILGKLFEIENN